MHKENIPIEGKQDLMILVWELDWWQATKEGNPPNPTLQYTHIHISYRKIFFIHLIQAVEQLDHYIKRPIEGSNLASI